MRGASGNERLLTLLVAGLLCSTVAVCGGAEQPDKGAFREKQMRDLGQKENRVRAARIAEVDKLMEEARAAWEADKFDVTRIKMEEALKFLGNLPGQTAEDCYADVLCEYNDFCNEWAEKHLKEAERAYSRESYQEAMTETAAAWEVFPLAQEYAYVTRLGKKVLAIPGDLYASWQSEEQKFGGKLEALNRRCQAKNKAVEFAREVTLTNIDKSYNSSQKEIEKLLRESTTYMQNGKYANAVDTLEKVYLLDPFNVTATAMLKNAYNKLYTAGFARKRADIEAQLANDAWAWIEPVNYEVQGRGVESTETKTPATDVFAKLDRIILTSLELEDSDIDGVIDHLNQRSRTYDPDQEGVSFSIAMPQAQKEQLGRVNVKFANIPLSEALNYICQDLGLQYRVDAGGVSIGTSVDNLQQRTMTVRAELLDRITSEAGGGGGDSDDFSDESAETMGNTAAAENAGGGGGGGGDSEMTLGKIGEGKDYTSEDSLSAAASIRKSSITPAKLKEAFMEWGIDFGPGTTVSYDPRGGRLIVKNTVDNLRRLSELLTQMDAVDSPLVMVEVKLVEVTETDLQELGFDWSFSMNNSDRDDPPGAHNRWTATTGKMVRSSNDMLGSEDAAQNIALVKDLKLLPNFGNGLIDGVNMDLSLTINAVSQNKRAETLSAPKIIASKGVEASMSMTRSYYFPESWEAPEIETSGNYTTITEPTPEWGDSTDVGIMLKVTPDVDPDNSTITLKLLPQVVSYIGQTDDTVFIGRGYIDYNQDTPEYVYTWSNNYKVWMPILAENSLDVTIKVKDGETIVLGGMVQNVTETVFDRWPVLGDVPLLGRLFGSQYEKMENRNLLIFVTARLVNNDGMPFRQNVSLDIPDFRR